ncbi:interferon-inducible GTPase 5-like [Lissotriton helveticus]
MAHFGSNAKPFEISKEEFKNIVAAFRLPDCGLRLSKELLEKTQLDIAVTGESGCGKSTFINAMRGMTSDDKGAAPTSAVEKTTVPTAYPYQHRENVKLWDLPGIGTPNFMAETYLQRVNFHRYDFFILVFTERIRENLILLADAVQNMGKQFYFVRSKIDNDIEASKRRKKQFNMEEILQKIRDDCTNHLTTWGLKYPHIFLLSSFDIGKFDFLQMQKVLEEELPEHKRNAFLLSLPNISQHVVDKKKEALKTEIWKLATLSCTIAVLPVPGLSIACDIAILIKAIRGYLMDFGLDEESLQKVAQKINKPVETIRSVVRSQVASTEITTQLVTQLLMKNGNGALMTFEYFMRNIPLVSGGISFATTYYLLRSILDDLAEDAKRVLLRSLEG